MAGARKTITIAGGGIAGLTLGIMLRRNRVAVHLVEAGSYPRHRVCGEFISGRGIKVLHELEVKQTLLERGAVLARSVRFFGLHFSSPVLGLPEPALCISRYVLDAVLASGFVRLGGVLREKERMRLNPLADGTVIATGRQPRLDPTGWRLWGLKVHARNLDLEADLEMHANARAYIGMCRIENHRVNVCGIFRSRHPIRDLKARWFDYLKSSFGEASARRFDRAEFDLDSFRAVAGLDYQSAAAVSPGEIRIGDAMALIPPISGNGMSLAFESARLAAGPLTGYARDELSWQEAGQAIAAGIQSHFSRRLFWARQIQSVLFSSMPERARDLLARHARWFYQPFFLATR